MRAKPFKQSSATAFPEPQTNEIVAEALARKAARKPAPTPPKELAVPPTLPKVRRPLRGGKRRKAK